MSSKDVRHKKRFAGKALVVVFLLLVSGAAGGYYYLTSTKDTATNYTLLSLERNDLEELVTATGRLQPRNYVDVGAQVSGQLTQLHVEVGEVVKEGDLLAEIDSTVYLATVDSTRAQLRAQRAQLEDRRAQLTLAEFQYRRQRNLLAENATTEEAYQSAEAGLRSAKAQITALEAQIEQAESTLRAEEAKLNYAQIYSPMDGTVVSIAARQGQTINATQQTPVIMQIADLSVMTVQAQVSEADINRIKPGMEVYFTTLGGQGQRWHGQVRRIEPTPVVENNVVLYNTLFDVPNEAGELMPQMSTQVFFVVASTEQALLLPYHAVQMNTRDAAARKASVQVLNEQGMPEPREITIGVSNRVQVEILSGLSETDQVVLPSGRGSGSSQRTSPGGGGMLRGR
ncbi:efflux RND transporter periplasmic adaptor subunit [Nitrincola sp. MINF-07-Sa-05]|uniref:efflux RND transporter periplasmic adaptor subunit n=1 Tax=Nitrincola salilacus TaxID=3400273 RepID=UPI0039185BC3